MIQLHFSCGLESGASAAANPQVHAGRGGGCDTFHRLCPAATPFAVVPPSNRFVDWWQALRGITADSCEKREEKCRPRAPKIACKMVVVLGFYKAKRVVFNDWKLLRGFTRATLFRPPFSIVLINGIAWFQDLVWQKCFSDLCCEHRFLKVEA